MPAVSKLRRPLGRGSRAAGALSGLGLALTLVLVPHAAVAARAVVDAGTAAVPGRYVVTVAPNGADVGEVARELAGDHGGRVGYVYDDVLKGFSLSGLDEAGARALAADPMVARVYEDRVVTAAATQTGPPWGLDRIDQRALPLDHASTFPGAVTGAGVDAFIVDTGLFTEHNDFGGRATIAFDVFSGRGRDCDGHGTHVAGTVGGTRYGVAKGVNLRGVKVLQGCGAVESWSSVIAGLDWVAANRTRPSVVNLSIASEWFEPADTAVRDLVTAGVPVVVAAGNGNAAVSGWSPGRVTEAITVGAVDHADRRAARSNFGPEVDLFAPGAEVISAGASGPDATEVRSGTSMAAPHVTGIVARYLQVDPDASPADIEAVVTGDATAGVVGDPEDSPNRLAYAPPDPAPRGGLDAVTGTTVSGWADDRGCPGPVQVTLTADPPDDDAFTLATVPADRPEPGHGSHGFTLRHGLIAGTVVTATAGGLDGDCTPAGSGTPLAGSGRTVPPGHNAAGPPGGPAVFVPVGQRGGTITGLQVLNSGAERVTAGVSYVRSDGTVAGTSTLDIPAGSSATSIDQAPAGFGGSAVITGGDDLTVVVNHVEHGNLATSAGATRGAATLLLPLLKRDHYGSTTSVAVQNTSRGAAGVTVTYSYAGPDGRPMATTDTIPALATKIYRQADAPGSPPTLFSARVTAPGGALVATVSERTGGLLEYRAPPLELAATSLSAPLVVAGNFGGAFTGVQVQNAGSEATAVTVTYGPNGATIPAPGRGLCPAPGPATETVQPGQAATFLQRDGGFSGCTYVGAATITAGQPIVAVVDQAGAGTSAYEAQPTALLTGTARLPLVQFGNYGTTGGLQIANHGTQAGTATITFGPNTAPALDPSERQPAPCPAPPGPLRDVPLDVLGTRTILLPADTPETAGCRYVGSVTVTSSSPGVLLGVLANQVTPGLADGLGTYTANNPDGF